MNIAEEVARKRASGVSPAIERRFIRESGSPSRRLSIPSKQTPWPTTFCHSFTEVVFGDSFALYLCIRRAGPQTPSERPPKYAPAVLR